MMISSGCEEYVLQACSMRTLRTEISRDWYGIWMWITDACTNYLVSADNLTICR